MGTLPRVDKCAKEGCTCPLRTIKVDVVTPTQNRRVNVCPCHFLELYNELAERQEELAKLPPQTMPGGSA